jgi:flagellar biogenesis protein FliO
MGYITNFIVYTLAMVGVIVVALIVFKNATSIGSCKGSKYLKIIDSISLGQRKNLFIVSTGKEQFLIAGDVNNTCLISKIENLNPINNETKINNLYNDTKPAQVSFQETLNNLPKQSFMDKSNIGIKSSAISSKTSNSVMKNLADILKQ